jgi:hypothetical protein
MSLLTARVVLYLAKAIVANHFPPVNNLFFAGTAFSEFIVTNISDTALVNREPTVSDLGIVAGRPIVKPMPANWPLTLLSIPAACDDDHAGQAGILHGQYPPVAQVMLWYGLPRSKACPANPIGFSKMFRRMRCRR